MERRRSPPTTKACVDCGELYFGHHLDRMGRCIPCRKIRARFLTKIHQVVRRAIKATTLVREPCEVCSADQSEAHHDDYTKPLSVRWLCRVHHRQHHEQEWRAARVSQQGDAR